MDGGEGGDVRDGDGYRIRQWEDNAANITSGKEPNAPLSYALGLECHHRIMIMFGDHRGQLEIEREIVQYHLCLISLF